MGWIRRSGVIVDGEPHVDYWGHGEQDKPDLATLADDVRLPMVRSVDMIHVAVIGGDSQWWMGFSPGLGKLRRLRGHQAHRLPRLARPARGRSRLVPDYSGRRKTGS